MDAIAQEWLSQFAAAASAGDVQATTAVFHSDGWLRDVLVFTWDFRSLEGQERIAAFLSGKLQNAGLHDFKLDSEPFLQPEPSPWGIGFGFWFETAVGHGHGYAHIANDESTGGYKAVSVGLILENLKGYEESGPESGVYGGHTLAWEEVRNERVAKIESNPQVVIVGAGQTGLNIAARFKQNNIPTIVLEKCTRVGDQWRQRYPTLTLHTPRNQHQMLYHPYPKTWPDYTPRDKLADWMEGYAESQDLVVWTKSTLLPGAKYDKETKRWTIKVDRDGKEIELHPAHIVVTIGTLGAPRVPKIPSHEVFKGEKLHAAFYRGGQPYAGKRCVVVGAGNTSADMCQDLSFRGASSVTMIQRSSTCVVAHKSIANQFAPLYPTGIDVLLCDFKVFAIPMGLQRKTNIANQALVWEREKPIHDLLRKGGFKLNMGPDGSGQHLLVYDQLGGYFIDIGCAELVGSGKVKVRQGVEPTAYTENGLLMSDGSEIETDVIIWATGYVDPRNDLKAIFGADVIDQTKELWGLDEEDEGKGAYRSTGYPGLWYGAGSFPDSRIMSKALALQLKAIEIGLLEQ